VTAYLALALSGLASTTITTGAIGVPASSFVGRGVASTVRPGAASGVAAVFFSIGHIYFVCVKCVYRV